MTSALARHDALLRAAIEGCGGHVITMRGDGAHAVFSTAISAVEAISKVQLALAGEPWGQVLGTGPCP